VKTTVSAATEAAHIRELAHQVAEIAHSERTRQLRNLWARHNSLEKVERPPVMCRPVSAWRELVPPESLVSTDPLYRDIELILRMRLYKRTLDDDEVCEPWVDVPAVHVGPERALMWGVNIDVIEPGEVGGAFRFKPEVKEESDLAKLRVPDWRVDDRATRERCERASELLGGILDVRITYGRLRDAGLAYWGAYLRGLEQMMYDCLDRPQWLHRFMAFLRDAHLRHLAGLEAEGHVVRNDNGACNSPCLACRDLPPPDFDPGRVRLRDTWCDADSQEFTLVSPAMWEDFLLAYQLPIIERHAFVSYGCCESLDGKVDILRRQVPNLRRVTVSPWSDIARCALHCGRSVVMQIRPSPAEVLTTFDERQMRQDLVHKMELAGDTIFEFCLQDIETVGGRPETLRTWTRIAKAVGAERYRR
jgi:hypothetical protein